ncbi:MAG: hypothetical protein MI739_13525 [Bacteroidales bacterium]|nr:hypothetical protein [Bacteroidales bacterium]
MRKIIFVLITIATISFACKNNQKQNQNIQNNQATWINKAKNVTSLLETANSNIGNQIHVKGTVNHVCQNSGKKLILLDLANDLSIRVEAAGEIAGFNQELNGSTIAVKGILREKKLTAEQINNWENKVKNKAEDEHEHEHAHKDGEEGDDHCSSEMANINKMRQWMKNNNKDYYSIYFIDGTDYEILD